MKIYKYEIELSDSNDRDYYKKGIVIEEDEEKASEKVYNYYRNKTCDYVSHYVKLVELDVNKSGIIEDC